MVRSLPNAVAGRSGNANWFNAGGGDGFYSAMDPRSQHHLHGIAGRQRVALDLGSGSRYSIMRGNAGRISFEDSLIVARGDTTEPLNPALTSALAHFALRRGLILRRGIASTGRLLSSCRSIRRPRSTWPGIGSSSHLDRGDNFYPDLAGSDGRRFDADQYQHEDDRWRYARCNRRRDVRNHHGYQNRRFGRVFFMLAPTMATCG